VPSTTVQNGFAWSKVNAFWVTRLKATLPVAVRIVQPSESGPTAFRTPAAIIRLFSKAPQTNAARCG
jgi:hypothetical protein